MIHWKNNISHIFNRFLFLEVYFSFFLIWFERNGVVLVNYCASSWSQIMSANFPCDAPLRRGAGEGEGEGGRWGGFVGGGSCSPAALACDKWRSISDTAHPFPPLPTPFSPALSTTIALPIPPPPLHSILAIILVSPTTASFFGRHHPTPPRRWAVPPPPDFASWEKCCRGLWYGGEEVLA